jgi:hypothetical protein
MSDKIDAPASPKELLRQLMLSATNGVAFKAFLQSHLADDALGAVAPRYQLNKAQTIERMSEFFAMAAGGSATMLANMEEGASACCRILLSSHRHDIRTVKSFNTGSEQVFEGALWMDLKPDGRIARLNLVGDALTPGLSMGRQMVRAQPVAQ